MKLCDKIPLEHLAKEELPVPRVLSKRTAQRFAERGWAIIRDKKAIITTAGLVALAES